MDVSSTPSRAVMRSKTTAPGKVAINLYSYARDISQILMKNTDFKSSASSKK